MAANAVVCPECGSAVPSGRLSCASCGALLASVTGAKRRTIVTEAQDRGSEPFDEDRPIGTAEPKPALEPAPEPEPATTAEPATAVEPAAEPEPEPEPAAAVEPAPEPEPVGSPHVEPPAAASAEPQPARGVPSILHEWTGPEPEAPSDAAAPAGSPPGPAAIPPGPPPAPAIPGAYLAPSAMFASPISPPPQPASSGLAAAPVVAPPASPSVRSRAATVLGGVSVAIPRELPDWLAIAGSALAIASFPLPWATDGVIGASGIGYFANWGLANPGHLLLVLAALVVLVLSVFPNRLPGWIRTGVLPLVVGGVLLGLAFAYHARPFGGGTGVTVLLVAALVLLIGGLVGVRPGRNESGPPSV